ncbi:hypothetical protein [Arthrobacter sp. ISL-69]|uniref:hypothetical protein n=1 Tax=Arthrobacter sp. ISL-69 TaxID=2819113 RepID=UPI001BE5A1FA|nr:hypothetical protein [Arthrobacter sp. ISL-69]MBT2536032.1 hypothetical protein [Arthrobacter sp. ISL-69]
MADSSIVGSADTVVIPVLEGQTCIGELLLDFNDVLGMTPREWGPPDADGSAAGQLRLF